MTPRRKKDVAEEAVPAGAEGQDPPAPKKRVSRAKKSGSSAPPTPPAAAAVARMTAEIPIQPAPPPKLTVEPDTRFPVEAAEKPEDRWTPAKRETNLSTPPSFLLNKRKMPAPEVEDILEEPEPIHEPSRHNLLKPPVRTGLYRKLGIGFAVAAVAVLLLVGYVAYAHATVVVYPRQVEVKTVRVVNVSASPSAADEIPGEVEEVIVSGEKTFTPGQGAVQPPPTAPALAPSGAGPAADENAVYTGTAIIYDKTGSPITLVEKTRLLSKDGILFRLKKRVTIAAGGKARAKVYADKPGPTGAIGPTSFTIPGLHANLQTLVYAVSDAAMTANGVAAPAVQPVAPALAPSGAGPAGTTVSANDLAAAEKSLRDDLTAQAKEEIAKKISGHWSGEAYLVETMSRFVSAAVGQSADQVVIRLTIRVRSVGYDQKKAKAIAEEDLKRGLTSDRELAEESVKIAGVMVDHADPKSGAAAVRVSLTGNSSVSLKSPLFDANKLRGLDLNHVKTYFEGIEGVERVDVHFRPFWIKRMPDLADHIDFQIAK